MNQVFLVIGATLCYVGGFGIMIFLLGILTELCIEIWDSNFRQICVRFQIAPGDVSYFAQSKKRLKQHLRSNAFCGRTRMTCRMDAGNARNAERPTCT